LRRVRRNLARPAIKLQQARVMMQFHHEKEVDLGHKGSPSQDSTELAVIFVTAQGCSSCVKIISRPCQVNPE
jgi:hypothetical protein